MSDTAFVQMGKLIPEVLTTYSSDADNIFKQRDVRASLYEQIPNEYMQRTPLTKMVLAKKGPIAKNVKVEWGMMAHNPGTFTPTACYSDQLSTAVGASAKTEANSTVYVKMKEAEAVKILPLEEIELRHLADSGVQGSVMLDVISVTRDGDDSFVKATVLEKDTDDVLGKTDSKLHGSIISMAVPEGSRLPGGRYQEPTMKYNFSQIFMSGLSVTGSELADVTYFDKQVYDQYLKQTHEQFNRQIERALKFGVRLATTATQNIDGYNQTVKRHKMGGLRWFHKNQGGNYLRIPELSTYAGESFSGKTWAEYGYPFLKVLMNELSKFGTTSKVLLASNKVMLDICDLFESMTNVTIGSTFKNAWGFEVTEVKGLNCSLQLQQDAGLSTNPGWENTVFIVEPELMEVRARKGRDMTLIRSSRDIPGAIENGFEWRDAVKEGIIADFTFTMDGLDGMAVIEGWGQDFAA